MSKPDFSVKTYGTFIGIKVNSSGTDISRAMKITKFSRSYILNKLRPLFKQRLENRIPKLIEQLQRGIQGLPGTRQFEKTSNEFGHRPHRDIPDPLSRIVAFGTSYKLKAKKDRLEVEIKPYNNRDGKINFHNKMPGVPRISTVWNRLDATCLPFFTKGYHTDIYVAWLGYSRIGLAYAIDDFLKGNTGSKKESL